MTGAEADLGDRTLRRSRRELALLSLTSAVLLGGGLIGVDKGDVVKGWFVVAFFGACLLVFLVMMLPGAGDLRLHAQGFEVGSLFRRWSYRWSDVESFGVARIGVSNFVVFNLAEGHERDRRKRALARSVSGWEASLPASYGMSPRELADLMNAYTRRVREAARRSA